MKLNFSKLKNQDGAVLLYAIFMITVLSILGITLATVSMSALQMTDISKRATRSFYKADSAIEEVVWTIEEKANEFREEASEYVEGGYLNTDEWRDFVSDRKAAHTTTRKVGEETVKVVDKKALLKDKRQKLKEVYKRTYYNRLETYVKGLDSVEAIRSEITLLSRADSGGRIEIAPDDIKYNIDNDASGSDWNPDEQIPEKMTLDIVATGYTDVTLNSVSNMPVADYWKESDGEKSDGETERPKSEKKEIKRSVELSLLIDDEYTGEDSEALVSVFEAYQNDLLENAITAGGSVRLEGGNLTVNGNLYSYGKYPTGESKYIQPTEMGGIETDGSGSMVINGDAYTRSNIQTIKPNSTISISGDAYADSVTTNLSASSSKIDIKGRLTVYDDVILNGQDSKIAVANDIWGVLDGDPGGKHSDASSSMVSNARGNDARISAANIHLGGVSYISIINDEDQFYKKGESASPSQYSYFYQEPIESEQGYSYFREYQNLEKTQTYELVEYLPGTSESNTSETKFKMDHFLTYGYNNRERFTDDRLKSIIQIGNEKSEANDRVSGSYTLGSVVANGYFYNPEVVMMGHDDYAMDVKPRLRAIFEETHLLKTRNYSNSSNDGNRMDEFLDKSAASMPDKKVSAQNAIIIDSNITIQNGSIGGQPVSSGFIYSQGDINIDGNFTFDGVIICEGDVVIKSGTVAISSNKQNIYDMVLKGDISEVKQKSLYNFLRLGEGALLKLYSSEGTEYNKLSVHVLGAEEPFIRNVNISGADRSRSLVEVQSWNEE